MDIDPGEELCFTYCIDFQFMTFSERTAFLDTDSRQFKCLCDVCSQTPEQQLVSDMRRLIMRHLLYWMYSRDLSEAPPTITLPDPKISIRNMLGDFRVYDYLLLMLAEAEGVRAGVAISKAYMTAISNVVGLACGGKHSHLPVHTLKTLRQWLQTGHQLARIQFGPGYRSMHEYAVPVSLLKDFQEDGKAPWVGYVPGGAVFATECAG